MQKSILQSVAEVSKSYHWRKNKKTIKVPKVSCLPQLSFGLFVISCRIIGAPDSIPERNMVKFLLDVLESVQPMRQELGHILGKELRTLAIQTRDRLKLTQKEMGERLYMSESSYSDIETGRSHCSMPTTILLLEMQEESAHFLQTAVDKATGRKEKVFQTV